MKQIMSKNIEVTVENGHYSDTTVKKIYQHAIFLSLNSMLKIHEENIEERRKHFKNIQLYAELVDELFKQFFFVLHQGLRAVLKILDVEYESFEDSKIYLE
jgi:hypothetical protein